MKTTISLDDFRQAFRGCNRSEHFYGDCDRSKQFSHEGLGALFKYFEGIEKETGEEIELDVIAICLEYTEYKDFKELQENFYNLETIDRLKDETTVIEVKGGSFIIKDYN